LAVGLRLVSDVVASEMLDAFISTGVDDGELQTISRLETP
jgi:hypothetical protein